MAVQAPTDLPSARVVGRTAGRVPSAIRFIWRDKLGLLGLTILILFVVLAVAGPWLSPHDPATQSLNDRLLPPLGLAGGTIAHPLGTDNLGRDILSRVIAGARVSLIVASSVVVLAGIFGTVLGLVSGYLGGSVDAGVMRVVDTMVAFPGLLVVILILFVVGPSVPSVIVALALNGWMVYSRMTRGMVLAARANPYVEAAEVIGCTPVRVIFRHILPNLTAPLFTLAVLEFARVVLAEAAISFLGVGVQPPATSWGLDVASGRNYIYDAWWLVTFPGAAIAITVFGLNLFASWLRVISDPHEREKRFAAQAGLDAVPAR